MTRLIALYPASWRKRYEDEFLALLTERPLDLGGRVDIVRGAIEERLHPQVREDRAPEPDREPSSGGLSARWSGWLTLVGGALWILTLLVAINGPTVTDEYGTHQDATAALLFWLAALVCLGVGVIAAALSTPPEALARPAAAVTCLSGFVWAVSPWAFPFGAIAIAGLLVVGISAWRARVWRRLDAALLSVAVVGAVFVAITTLVTDRRGLVIVAFLLFGLAWVAVGDALVRPASRAVRPVAEADGS